MTVFYTLKSKKQYADYKTNTICDIKTCVIYRHFFYNSFVETIQTIKSTHLKYTIQWFIICSQICAIMALVGFLEHFHHLRMEFFLSLKILFVHLTKNEKESESASVHKDGERQRKRKKGGSPLRGEPDVGLNPDPGIMT